MSLPVRVFRSRRNSTTSLRWEVLARYGLSPRDVAALRDQFAGWPRTAEAADTDLRVGSPRKWQADRGDAEATPGGGADAELDGEDPDLAT